MDQEVDDSTQPSTRKRLSGHWGGNTAIENLYGKTSDQRKDNILDYIFQGYEPKSKKNFYERNEQTDLVLTDKSDASVTRIEEEFFHRRPEKLDESSSEAYARLVRSKSKSLVAFSEITITYENQGVGVNVFHFLKRRDLYIPLKDLKKETLRIVVFPPFIELYLGKHQVFPFDFSNVLGPKVKRSFEEKSMEVFQRMPKVFVIKADKNNKILGEVPLVDVSNRTENIEDFIFHDKYDYLPTGTSKSKTLGKDFNTRKIVFPDSKRTRCLQKNLANIHKPELFVTESQLSLQQKKPEKPNVCEKMKTFFKATPVETKSKYRESSDEDTIIFKPAKKEPEPIKYETEVKFHRRHISDSITLTHSRNNAKRQHLLAKERASRGKTRATMASSSSYPLPPARTKHLSLETEPQKELTKKEIKELRIKEFEKALLGSDADIPKEHDAPVLKSNLKKKLSLYAVPSASAVGPEKKGILGKIKEHTKSIIKTTKYSVPLPKKSEVSLDGDKIERRKSEKRPTKSIQYAQDTYWDNLYDASKNLHDEESVEKPKRSFFTRSRENLVKKTSSIFDHMRRKKKGDRKASKSAKAPQSLAESLDGKTSGSEEKLPPNMNVSKKDEDKKVKSKAWSVDEFELTPYDSKAMIDISAESSNGHLRNESSESVQTFQRVRSVSYSDDDSSNR